EALRAGAKVQRLVARLLHGDRLVAQALAALVRPAAVAVASPANDPPLPPPESGRPFEFPFFNDPVSYHAAMETRLARGEWGSGRVAAWMRQRLPLVAGTDTSPLERALEPRRDVGDLFRAHRMLHRVLVPLDAVARALEELARHLRALDGDERVVEAVRHEDRHAPVGGAGLRGEAARERQVRRERHDARQPLGVAQPRLERDRPALREARQHEARGRNAPRFLARDQLLDARLRGADARGVLAAHALQRVDVVPRAHDGAAVD